MNLVGVLIAGVVIMDISLVVRGVIVVLMAALLTGAILFSKRGGLSEMADIEAEGDEAHAADMALSKQTQTQEQVSRK